MNVCARCCAKNIQIELDTIAIEQPPEIKFGEYALPVAFELARKLKKAPRKIAEEIVAGLSPLEGFAGFEVAGAGYINARLDRGAAVRDVAAGADVVGADVPVHSLVEHTSINPNKAAHVGHLRNAILGDTFVRLLRAAGQKVDVQNYIDNTGVQVADIVVGLTHLEAAVACRCAGADGEDPCGATVNASTTTAGICTRVSRSGMRLTNRRRQARKADSASIHSSCDSSTAAMMLRRLASSFRPRC